VNIEELKLVIELLNGIADAGMIGIYLYFGYLLLNMLFIFTFFSTVLWLCYKLIKKGMEVGSNQEQKLRAIRDSILIGSPGHYTVIGSPGHYTDSEHSEVMNYIKRHIE
jgi:hypothetical protein